MQQDGTPLFDAITRYIHTDPAYFRIPGHRLEQGISSKWTDIVGSKIFAYDVTETPATDDLHHPEGVIREAQELAAELFGAKRSFFLVNGTTCGNEAMIVSAAHQGEKIMIARNAHKSAMMGLIMSGAEPVYVMPEILHSYGIQGGVTPEAVERTFAEHPDCKALFLVSPTYYGICSNLRQIADICHQYHALLLVDEAHGGHMYFRRKIEQDARLDKQAKTVFGADCETLQEENVPLPQGALEQGADMCVQSMHKITGALGQSSILHIGSDRVDANNVAANLQLVQSTSPSYLLMTSLDLARYELAMHGVEMNQKAWHQAQKTREELLQIPGIQCMGMEVTGSSGIQDLDRTRLTISARKLGLSGYELDHILFERYHVDMELSDQENVLAIFTYANRQSDGSRLVEALRQIAEELRTSRPELLLDRANMLNKPENMKFPTFPQQAMTPREAYFANRSSIPWEQAKGEITAEMLAPYPPGIPVIYPGEVITEEIWNYMEQYRKGGHPMHGSADDTLKTIQIVRP